MATVFARESVSNDFSIQRKYYEDKWRSKLGQNLQSSFVLRKVFSGTILTR